MGSYLTIVRNFSEFAHSNSYYNSIHLLARFCDTLLLFKRKKKKKEKRKEKRRRYFARSFSVGTFFIFHSTLNTKPEFFHIFYTFCFRDSLGCCKGCFIDSFLVSLTFSLLFVFFSTFYKNGFKENKK